MISRESQPTKQQARFQNSAMYPRSVLGLLVAIISLGLILFAVNYYRTDQEQIRQRKYAELAAIAELKVAQIVQWRQERLSDAQLVSGDPFLVAVIMEWLANPRDLSLKASLLERLSAVRNLSKHQNVIIAGPDGHLLLSVDASLTGLDAGGRELVHQALASQRVVFGDLARDQVSNLVSLDVVSPLLDENNIPVAALILRSDPQDYLYPLIQSWPLPSASGETLLVRRDGDSALYLNSLRHNPDRPLSLRVPLANLDLPAAQVVLGRTGLFEGKDYAGDPVLAELRPVPDSTWFMVAKISTTEILAESTYHGLVTLFLTALAIFLTASLAAIIYIYRQRFLVQKLLITEQERRRAQDEIRATLYGIGDGVISTDASGLVRRLNPVAENLTGWKEAEALGLPLTQVFQIVSELTRQDVPNPVERVLREGKVVGLANHTMLISRDGRERAIADSAAPIRAEDGALSGVVLVFRDQEQERADQKALQASQQKFMTVFQSSPDAILLTSVDGGQIVDANLATEVITGYTRAEMLGHTTAELGMWVNLEERAAYAALARSGQRMINFETNFRVKNGSVINALISGEVIQIEAGKVYLSVVRDITSRKQIEMEARQRESLMRALIDNAPFEVWARDLDGVCILENATRVRARGSILGQKLSESAGSPEELATWLAHNRSAYAGQIVDIELANHLPGGERYFQSIVAPIIEDQLVSGIVGFNIDITRRKLAENALALEKEELTRSNAELEQFAYVASHDLQEPLRMVSSYMQLIEKRYKGKLDANADEFIAFAVDGATRMQRLINDLLMFSRVGTRGKPFGQVSCEAAFDQAVQNLKMSIEEQQAVLTHDPLPEVLADGSQLVQLFQNLLGNAIKFHGTAAPRVHLSVEAGQSEWVFALRDNGIGIEPQYFERIFVLFQRLHERSAYAGTGIGLAICKKIVQRHGGRIWLESTQGQGTTFYFSLPKNGQGA